MTRKTISLPVENCPSCGALKSTEKPCEHCSQQTVIENNDIRHKAAGNLAFLLSVIRCGETLHADEEAHVRAIIDELESAAIIDREVGGERLDCAMCGASDCFVINPFDDSDGYCFREQRAWKIRQGLRREP